MSDSYAQQYPLDPMDDHLIHQMPQPLRYVYTSDARAYERFWFTAQDDVGELFVVVGGGFYPNLDTAEAYAIVNHRGRHTTVRHFRRLGRDRMNLRFGPIQLEVVRGLRTWRLLLDENEWGVSFDMLWHDTKRQIFDTMPGRHVGGRVLAETAGFEGFGYPEGHVTVRGERIALGRERFRGSRDRHWGVRFGVGGPGHNPSVPGFGHGGQWVEFDDWSIWGSRILYNFDDPRPGAGKIIKQDRKLRFDPESKVFVEGIVTNVLEDGRTLDVHYERLGNQTAYLRCGMYAMGPSGGTPDRDIWQGMYVGDDVTEGETYDVNDRAVQARISGLNDHHCRVTCGDEVTYGIFEPVEPTAYEWCKAGVPGYALLD